jgi:hypothetical protein
MFIIDLLETGTTNQSPKIAKRLAVRLVQILLDAVFHLAFGDVVLQKSAAAFVQVGLHVSIVDHMAPMAAMAAMAVPIQVPTKARIFRRDPSPTSIHCRLNCLKMAMTFHAFSCDIR